MDPQDRKPQPQTNPEHRKLAPSAPVVPRELLSARPAMTRVVPKSPDKIRQASQAMELPVEPVEETTEVRRERIDYLKNLREDDTKPHKKKKSKKKLFIIVGIIVLLLVIAGGAIFALNMRDKSPASQANNGSSSPSTATNVTPSDGTSTEDEEPGELKDYDSTAFSLSFKYPSNWKISETAGKLTITSPEGSIKTSTGKMVRSQTVVVVRGKQTMLDEFKTGAAAAVLDSKKVTYTQPASGQRGTTYVSYAQYDTTTVKGALDGIYVTGNSGYQKGQAIPQADVVRVDPLISVYFTECVSSGTCAVNAPSISVEAAALSTSTLNKTIEDIFTSFAIRG